MGCMTVKFLGKDYSIPEDVLIYIDLLDFTENIKKQLAGTFVRKLRNEIQKDNIGLIGDEDLAPEIEKQVGRFIAKLCDNGIFTRTINDYWKSNKGYQLYSDVNKAALEKMKSLLIREMDDWQAGYEHAVSKAESHVTGMGFSIWSSSFVNHAIYAAMEASTLNKQSKEAEAQYQRDMNDLRSRLDSRYGGEKSKYINDTYIPNMEAALTVFAYELLDKYVADLIANGKFDAKTLDYVDIGRSNDLLKNLTLSNNKQAILENAFAACPYNIAVYMQAMKYDLLNYDSFQTAKVFKQDHLILSFFKENWGEVLFPTKFNVNYHCIKVWASLTDVTSSELLRGLTDQYATGILLAYARIADILTNDGLCRKILKDYSDDDILVGDAICRNKAHDYVSSIATFDTWEQITKQCGHEDLFNRIKKHFSFSSEVSSKTDLDKKLTEELTDQLQEARVLLVAQISERREQEKKQRCFEAEQKAKAAELRKKQFRKAIVIGCITVAIIVLSWIATSFVKSHLRLQEEQKIYQEKIERIENIICHGKYDDAVKTLISSDLSEEQKQDYYNLLIERIGFNSFEVNGLVFHIPEHWYIRDYSDPYIAGAQYPEDDSPFALYVKYMGTADQVTNEGDDYWKTRNDFSETSIPGCANAYLRYDSGHNNKKEQYFVIEHFVECSGQIYQIQFLAYEGRYYEPEVWMLLERVEFTNYAENRANFQEQKYLNAIDLLDKRKYQEALSIFVTLEGYKESTQKITECNDALIEEKYSSAIALANRGQYKDALFLFEEIGDYKDAAELSKKYARLACEAGDVIILGAYEQDNHLDNGEEPIEWIVLERDGNTALVISKYCLDWMPFNESFTHATWKNSTIRNWLNQVFLNQAFSSQEINSIIATQISNPDDSEDNNSHGTSTDKVFMLSLNEADKFFSNNSAREASGTEYACSKGKSASWCWWLRSAGSREYVAYVSSGEIGYYEEIDRNMGIRPVMWINIDT